jgi:hypothetical protein
MNSTTNARKSRIGKISAIALVLALAVFGTFMLAAATPQSAFATAYNNTISKLSERGANVDFGGKSFVADGNAWVVSTNFTDELDTLKFSGNYEYSAETSKAFASTSYSFNGESYDLLNLISPVYDAEGTLKKIFKKAKFEDSTNGTVITLAATDVNDYIATDSVTVNSDVVITAAIENSLISSLVFNDVVLTSDEYGEITLNGVAVDFSYSNYSNVVTTFGSLIEADGTTAKFELSLTDKSTADKLYKALAAKVTTDGETITENFVISGDVTSDKNSVTINNGKITSVTKYNEKKYSVELGFNASAKLANVAARDTSNAIGIENITEEQRAEIKAKLETIGEQFSGVFASITGVKVNAQNYTTFAEKFGIDLSDPNLLYGISEAGVDVGKYAEYADGAWAFDIDAIVSDYLKQ